MDDLEVLEQKSKSMFDRAREMQVTCDEEYSLAGEFVMGCKSLIKEIGDAHEANIDRWHKGHKAALADRDKNLLPVQQALEFVGGKNGTALIYKQEQDRLAKEEGDRIDRENNKTDEDARLKEAERLEAEGQTEEAEKILDTPPPPVRHIKFITSVPKVAGLSTKKEWKARIVQPSKVVRSCCLPDQTIINMTVKGFMSSIKDPTPEQIKKLEDEIGGVVVEQVETFAGRIRA